MKKKKKRLFSMPSPFGMVNQKRFRLAENDRRSADPSNVTFGMGMSGLTGERLGEVIDYDPNILKPQNLQSQLVDFKLIETTEQLRTSLSVSAAASYRSLSVDAGAHAQYFRQTSVDKYSIKALGRMDITLNALFLTQKKLSKAAKETLHADRQMFMDNFGDQFIDQIVYGGVFILLIDYVAESKSEFESISAGVKAAMKGYAANGDIAQTFERLFKQKYTSIWLCKNGSVDPIPLNPNDLVIQFLNFSEYVKQTGGVPVRFETLASTTAQGGTDVAKLKYTKAALRFEELARLNDKLAEVRESWARVSKNPAIFMGGDYGKAVSAIAELDKIEDEIKLEGFDEVVENCLSYKPPSDVQQYPRIRELENELPDLIGTFRPQIRATYMNSDKIVREKIVNLYDPNNVGIEEDWVEVRSGGKRVKYGIGFDFVNQPPGLSLEYRVTFHGLGDIHGWVKGGTFLQSPDGSPITGIAFRLTDSMKNSYFIDYMVHCIDVGDSARVGNAPNCVYPESSVASNQGYLVQGFRIMIYPK